MSEIDLVLLGQIKKYPQSAYDLQKSIEYKNISHWVKMSNTSIYNNVKQLCDKGYIEGTSMQNPNMPPKIVFHITEKGDKYLDSLMLKMSEKQIRLMLSFNAVIMNLNCVDETTSIQCLQNISEQLQLLEQHICGSKEKRQEIPLIGRSIITQQLDMAEYLSKWIEELKEELQKEGINRK